ncbi:HAD family hydrolase [Herpetosiphon llansteffanensis]|uniref:HAD family hydrolase n=1 Tax=Herpetosiphon llansteffanensis TaxID=2094568 RepID=UPI000D7BE77D|nr:HAD hydrolase-like protein [Herpetosiphon llansteffanensis]
MKSISVLITDLDNTLYDWVHMWYESFNAMLDEIIKISNVDRNQLLKDIRQIHQKYGSSEYSFLIEEIPSLRNKHSHIGVLETYISAINAYRNARKKSLNLYPTVYKTLRELKSKGTLIVAYTESKAFYTNYRLRSLNLDGIIDFVYSPKDHLIDEEKKIESRLFSEIYYELKKTKHFFIPDGEHKPNPKILMDIISNIGANINNTIYIGDSLMKDIAMAQECAIIDVYAKYGVSQHKEEYELLRNVSHWTDEDVEREKEIQKKGLLYPPSYILNKSFSEILTLFNFIEFDNNFKD